MEKCAGIPNYNLYKSHGVNKFNICQTKQAPISMYKITCYKLIESAQTSTVIRLCAISGIVCDIIL